MTRQQATWASQHDWFVREQMWGLDSFVVSVMEHLNTPEGWKETLLQFADFSELRAWAGY